MIVITKATEADLSLIQDMAHQTWPQTFSAILSLEQIEFMLDMMYSQEALKAQINEKNHVFLLAREGDDYLGYISYELNYQNEQLTKIHKIYLLPVSQGKGVGRQLIDTVANIAVKQANNRLGLNVNRYNKAVQFYERRGFSIIDQQTIDIGNGFLMDDFVMEKPL